MNTTKYPKRLIEVDLPIKRISAHARREKSIRHGHISTLHIWWARRPLAACRAVICAALWPDPVDENCPQSFRDLATEYINNFAKKAATDKELSKHCSTEIWSKWQVLAKLENQLDGNNIQHWNILRNSLLDFIADFANWDNSTQADYLETSRNLTQAAHEALGGIPGTKPLVVDPFAGGGSIPLEALRVGADAFASDINPVAVLLNKVVLEYIPKYGQQLADEVRKWGQWVKEEAEKELAQFYPKDADGSTPIAYLWARTIICEGPGCGAEVPLRSSLWLCKKSNRNIGLRIIPQPEEKRVDFEIIEKQKSKWVVSDHPEIEVKNPSFDGTVKRGSATCPCCGYTTPVASVRTQFKARQGGANDARLFCVVTTREKQQGRFYRLPNEQDLEAVKNASIELEKRVNEHNGELSLIPDEPVPTTMGGCIGIANYGHNTWGSLFSNRQALALTTLAKLIKDVGEKLANSKDKGLADAVQTCLSLVIDRQADKISSIGRWDIARENPQGTFARQALPIVWDFSEVNPISGAAGDLKTALQWVLDVCKNSLHIANNHINYIGLGQTEQANAAHHPLPNDFVQCLFSDPPYYNAIPYADLSDFFYVWLKRTLGNIYPGLFTTVTTPKDNEICEMAGWDSVRYPHKNGKWFEQQMQKAMAEGCRFLAPEGIAVIVFAHKSTSGWEAQPQAMVNAGWTMTGSWPIDTEMGNRLRAQNSAALASSVHIVCRPRDSNEIGDWRDVLQELPQRIHEWMPRLASEGVVGADAIFACLGPALEIFSRYSSVEKASGELVTLKEYLEYVWAAVSKEALSMIFDHADTTSFEEDARLTAMWLWTLSTGSTDNNSSETETDDEDDDETSSKTTKTGGYTLEFDAARKIAQGLGAHLEQLTRLVEVKGSTAKLLAVSERTKYLFGKEEAQTPSKTKGKKGKKKEPEQLNLFPVLGITETEDDTDWGEKTVPQLGNTTLDCIHQSMILFAAGRSEALKRFLVEEGAGNDQRFWGLAQALSALYPTSTEEKRWVDGVLARKKGLGF
jgi:adenine-specific DNA methylase